MKPTKEQRAFNATADGQRAMALEASRIGTVLTLNRAVRAKGGAAWDEKMIETASEIMRDAIAEDLRQEWNRLVTPATDSQAT